MKKCAFCAEGIQDAALVCKHCGRDQAVVTVPPRRRRRTWLWVLAAAVGLAILGALSGPARRDSLPGSDGLTRTQSQLEQANEDQRSQTLRTAIRSAGNECQDVTRTFFQGLIAGTGDAVWNATCSGGRSYAVMVKEDRLGSARVMECIDLKTVAKVECFTSLVK